MADSFFLSSLFSAWVTGLFGSLHCIGMCGGIVGTLTLKLSPDIQQSSWRLLPYVLSYNGGRILSYMLAGLIVGLIGSQFTQFLPDPGRLGGIISGSFMIALGLYLGNWWPALGWLEKLGSHLWKRIEPLGRRFFPVASPQRAFGLGLVWGWLPCGLVYTALTLALANSLQPNATVWHAVMIMAAFGIGTLPMLIAMGSTAHWLNQLTRQILFRRLLSSGIILFGLYLLIKSLHLS